MGQCCCSQNLQIGGRIRDTFTRHISEENEFLSVNDFIEFLKCAHE